MAEAAEQWKCPDFPDASEEVPADMCDSFSSKHTDKGCLLEQRAATSRLLVAKLYQVAH